MRVDVQVIPQEATPTCEIAGRRMRMDRRLVAIESMSAECAALLTKITIKQTHSRTFGYELPIGQANRTLLPV